MINNRQNGRNNRRGRGGPRPMGGGGGQGPRPDAGNRMDSRQRGNASQLYEKYKNLARDAQTQGDRVTAEYYLQFADHYFRVLSEHRARQEEFRERQEGQRERPRHQNEPRYDDGEDDGDGDEDVRDEDPTAPIAISGLPPAIGASAMTTDSYDEEGADRSDEFGSGDRQARGRGRGRPRQGDGDGQSRDQRIEQPARASHQQRDQEPAPRGAGDGGDRQDRQSSRRAPRNTEPESAQLDLPPAYSAASVADDEAPKPRRRTRRVRQEEGDAVADAEA